MRSTVQETIKTLFEKASTDDVAPGGNVAIIKNGNVESFVSCGVLGRGPTETRPVDKDTRYDIASLTKPICTTTLAMLAVDKGVLDLNKSLGFYLRQAKGSPFEDVNISELLGHSSGLPAHFRFFEAAWKKHGVSYTMPDHELIALILASSKAYTSGSKSVYSDLGFILLGKILESIYSAGLDHVFKTFVTDPLELVSTSFHRISKSSIDPEHSEHIAPTENCESRGRLKGVVHDENCHLMDGVAGHAGLFSTLGDLTKVLLAWTGAFHGESGFIKPETIKHFWQSSAAQNTSWKLGFDTPSTTTGVSHAGDKFSRSSIGHLGFTGTSIWCDPTPQNAVIILTNRVYDSREPVGIKSLRRALMDSITEHHFQ